MTTLSDVTAPHSLRQRSGTRPVLLFDERCGVCRRFVSFVVGLDRAGSLRIAPLHSRFGDAIRKAHVEYANRDSALFVKPDGTILSHSDAILASLEHVGGTWRHVARALTHVPRRIRDRAYIAFADSRSLFGRFGLPALDHAAQTRHIASDELPEVLRD
jgi:predicted DCC family thiol-disulfide oxidoreductase YuxK